MRKNKHNYKRSAKWGVELPDFTHTSAGINPVMKNLSPHFGSRVELKNPTNEWIPRNLNHFILFTYLFLPGKRLCSVDPLCGQKPQS